MQCHIRIGFVKTKRRFIQKECKNKKNQSNYDLKLIYAIFFHTDPNFFLIKWLIPPIFFF